MEVKTEAMPCVMCKKTIIIQKATTSNPEAPTMVLPPTGSWMGFMFDEQRGLLVITVCSQVCLTNLLSH